MKRHYAGLDVHKDTTYCVVMEAGGIVVAHNIVKTSAQALVGMVQSIQGKVSLTLEEGTHSAWLYDLLKPHVYRVIVCDPRKTSDREGKDDETDAHRLAEMLRNNNLKAVYHGDHGTRKLKELVRCYDAVKVDSTRAKNRLKAIFRSQGIETNCGSIYNLDTAEDWLVKLQESGLRRRAERMYSEVGFVSELAESALGDVVAESRKHKSCTLLKTIPGLGTLRSAVIVATVDTPFRFRTKRQFWSYCGFSVRTHSSGDHEMHNGKIRRKPGRTRTRGLTRVYNRALKAVFKGAAVSASQTAMKAYYQDRIERKMKPEMAMLTLARKISATALVVWKKGEPFEIDKALTRSE